MLLDHAILSSLAAHPLQPEPDIDVAIGSRPFDAVVAEADGEGRRQAVEV